MQRKEWRVLLLIVMFFFLLSKWFFFTFNNSFSMRVFFLDLKSKSFFVLFPFSFHSASLYHWPLLHRCQHGNTWLLVGRCSWLWFMLASQGHRRSVSGRSGSIHNGLIGWFVMFRGFFRFSIFTFSVGFPSKLMVKCLFLARTCLSGLGYNHWASPHRHRYL